ncbi:DUF4347 domain-containing protein [Bradyrhizobium sp. BWC-3-1]|uniref:DUF4347 domain-containing protein n=1 Tax=Bradyrhizobium sp. BWC-3-1 TaxID=3080012 RepID=UPI00293E2CC5|nr:DUF4347 domain-containing protein [Bradyrhizobium sp. BWC-3-1]WOH56056.1 DUF4347 domain-containing protein [Bradyrhizobium sp. BWC-3-1]
MTIRSNTNAATISNAIDRAMATAHPRALGGKSSDPASTTPKSEIAFIDPGVDDLQTLLKGIRPDVEPVLLSSDEPAMRQIAGALKGRGALKAIHIIAHGKPGEISFSSGSLSAESLSGQIDELASIGAAVADGELRLWCCQTAQGTRGRALLAAMADYTKADVRGSSNIVGSGSWTLDSTAVAPITADAMISYQGIMDSGNGTTVDNLNVLDAIKTNDTNGVEYIYWADISSFLTTSTNATQTTTIQQAFQAGQLLLTFQVGANYYTMGYNTASSVYYQSNLGTGFFLEQTDQYGKAIGQFDPITGQTVAGQSNVLLSGKAESIASFVTDVNHLSLFTGTTQLVTDALDGSAGKDNIQGIASNAAIHNIIQGGAGADVMSGGLGSDYFVFARATDSPAAGQVNPGGQLAQTWDQITNFQVGSDKLDFSQLVSDQSVSAAGGLTASAAGLAEFRWFGAQAANTTSMGSANGYGVWYTPDGSGGVYVYADTNGDGSADLKFQLAGVTGLNPSDFLGVDPPSAFTVHINPIEPSQSNPWLINQADASGPITVTGAVQHFTPSAQLIVSLNGHNYVATVLSNGTWTATIPAGDLAHNVLPDGSYQLTAVVKVGSATVASDSHSVAVEETPPSVISVLVSDPKVTDADATHSVTATITFSEAMDQTSTPIVSNNASGTLINATGGHWVDATHYAINYTEADANVELANISFSVSGAKDLAGNTQAAAINVPTGTSVDTKNATVTSVALSDSQVTDADATHSVTATITFSEAMDQTSTPIVSNNASGTLINATGGHWVDATHYAINYTEADANVELANISFSVSGAKDLAGNTQAAAINVPTGTSVDTKNATVTTVALSDSQVTDADATHSVTATITFSEAMDQTSTPIVSNNASGTLINATGGHWVDATHYAINYTEADANVELANISFSVSGAKDLAGNTQAAAINVPTGTSVDTKNATVTSVALSDSQVTDADATHSVTATITFSEAMDQTSTPIVSNNASGTLINATGGHWVDATHYAINYTEADANVELANISFSVSGAKDLAGNTQAAAINVPTGTSVDTKNATVTSVALSDSQVTDADATHSVTATITFSEAMDQTSTPIVSNNASGTLINATGGHWVDATHYAINYTEADANVELANISFSVSGAKDLAGNLQAAAINVGSGTSVDTSADVGADLALSITDTTINNSEKTAAGFSVAGLDADATGVVTFSDGTHHVDVNVSANGSYSADLSSLTDGPISSVLNVTDDAGNTAAANGAPIDLDTSADVGADLALSITDTTINNSEKTAAGFSVAGLDADATGVVTFSDGTHHVDVNVSANGSYSADLSSLTDGPISSVLNVTDDAGNTAAANGAPIDLDTSADVGADLALSITDTTINNSEKTAAGFSVAGLDADATGVVTFSDGTHHVDVNVSANGSYSADLSSLTDGPISSVLNVTDDAGNTAAANGAPIDLDTSADVGADLALSITDTTINNSEKTAAGFSVAGLDADATGVVTFSDGTHHVDVNVSANGSYSADLSSLTDGPISSVLNVTDDAGNTAAANGAPIDLDTSADVGADLALSITDTTINNSEKTAAGFSVAGLDADATGVVTFSDGTHHVDVNVSANGSYSADLSSLTDGPISSVLNVTDDAGNTAAANGAPIDLDTSADVGADLALSITDTTINNSEKTAAGFSVAGLDADATGVVTFSDGTHHVDVNVSANGSYSADLSSLTDGPISSVLNVTDDAGNTAAANGAPIDLDTSADVGADLALSITDTTINNSEKTAAGFSVAGLDADATGVVTFSDGTHHVDVNVSANGSYSADLSSLTDGPISSVLNVTDDAGNTAAANGAPIDLDTSADVGADLALSITDTTINNSEKTAAGFSVAGLDADATGVVTFSDGTHHVDVNVSANGSYSADLSSLTDGPISSVLNVTDDAGNTAAANGAPIDLDTSADVGADLALSITDTTINNSEKTAAGFSVAGLDADATGVVTFSDGTHHVDVNVSANGSYSADLSSLTDGPISSVLNVTDDAGNTAAANGAPIDLDTSADVGADLALSITDTTINNSEKTAAGFSVAGLDADATGVVTFSDGTHHVDVNVSANGSYSADLSSLTDGPISSVLNVTDDAGNTAAANGAPIDLDTSADVGADLALSITDTTINNSEKTAAGFSVAGLDADATGVVTFSDGTHHVDVNVSANGSYSADLSSLTDGPISSVLNVTDDAGNTAAANGAPIDLDTSADVGADLALSITDTTINNSEKTAAGFSVAGLDADATGVVTFSDGTHHVDVNVSANGSYSADLSSLTDGPISSVLNVTDDAGNTAAANGAPIDLDTSADVGADLALSITDTTINNSEKTAAGFSVAGLDADATGVVTFSDGTHHVDVNVSANGSYSADLSSLTDGPISSVLNVTDDAGNTAAANGAPIDLDTSADVGADLALSITDTTINNSEKTAAGFSVAGLDADATGVVTFSDGTHHVDVNVSANGSYSADLSSLTDGPISSVLNVTDDAGNTAAANGAPIDLDTSADVGADLALSITDTTINNSEKTAAGFSVAGLDADATGVVTFSDGTHHVDVNVSANGSYSADLSSLTDGPISSVLNVTDDAGNTAAANGAPIDLDTSADVGADLALSITDTTINNSEKTAAGFSVAGLDADATGVVTFSDGTHHVDVNVSANGSYSADLSSLTDGPISSVLNVTDDAGNTAAANGAPIDLDTSADVGADLALSITDTTINNSEKTAAGFSVAGLDADATGVVTFSDGTHHVDVNVSANGSYSADLSSLTDGPISSVLNVTDDAGNTAAANGAPIDLDTSADVGADLALSITDTTINNSEKTAAGFSVAGLDADATGVVTFSDGTHHVDVNVSANGSYSADLSSLTDGPISSVLNVTDDAGNTAAANGAPIDLDTSADVGADLALSITDTTINNSEKTAAGFSVAGLDADATGVVTFSDGTHHVDVNVSANGSYSADLSSLTDGPISSVLNVTDDAGNTAAANGAPIDLDTSADVGADLALSITDTTINNSEKTAAGFSVAGLDADATGVVTFSDGTHHVDVNVSANGSYSADLSSLTDGPISSVLNVTDDAGNTAAANGAPIDLDTSADVGADLALSITDTTINNSEKTAAGFSVAGLDADATGVVTFSDGTHHVDVNVSANGSYSADLSSLTDGPISSVLNVTDDAGNTAAANGAPIDLDTSADVGADLALSITDTTINNSEKTAAGFSVAGLDADATGVVTFSDGTHHVDVNVSANGSYSADLSSLTDGPISSVLNVTDDAGNTAAANGAPIDLDTSADVGADLALSITDTTINNSEKTAAGFSVAGLDADATGVVTFSDGTHHVDVNVSANGSYSADLSSLTDGPISSVLNVTDDAGNTAAANGAPIDLDTSADVGADLALSITDTTINNSEKTAAGFSVAGLDADATGVVTFSDGTHHVDVNVSANGSYSADLSSLTDGPISSVLNVTDDAGNTAAANGAPIDLDTSADVGADLALSITDTTINNSEKTAAGFSVAGLDADATGVVTFSDGTHHVDVNVSANGSYSADLSSLTDGPISSVLNVTDDAGNTAAANGAPIDLDTSADVGADLALSITDTTINNSEKTAAGFSVAGLDADATGVVTFSDGTHHVDVNVSANGSYSADLSSLTDGPISSVLNVTDDAGNTAAANGAPIDLDTSADVGADLALSITDTTINNSEKTAAGFSVAGLDADATGVVTFSDGTHHVDVNVSANGSYSADLSSLTDGPISSVLNVTDDAGNTAAANGAPIDLDTSADVGADLALSITDTTINNSEKTAAGFSVAGLDADATGVVTFSDGTHHVDVNVSANGSYSADLSSLTDGPISSVLNVTDDAGNTAAANGAPIDLDTSADVGADLALSITDTTINNSEKTAAGFSVAGLDADATGVVTFSDGTHHVDVNVSANGSYSADLSSLTDGPISSVLNVTDDAGNTAAANGAPIDLDTSADVGADLALSITDTTINNSEKTAAGFSVAGLDADATGVVTFSDGTHHVDVNVSANGSYSADLSSLTDGPISSVLNVTDDAGNTAAANGAPIDLDTSADVGADLALSITDTTINNSEKTAAGFSVAGLDADATGVVTFSDGTHHVDVNVSANGSYSADLSSLTDGPISSVLNVTDDAGNTAAANGAPIDLDTSADVGADLALSITDTTINNSEKTAAGFSVAGLDADATGVVTFSDGTHHVDVNVSANGSYSADLSSLTDGPISSVLNVTDDAGNTAAANGAPIDLDTSADVGADLALSITDTTINNSEKTAAGFSVAGLDADATGVVTFSDGTHHVDVNVSANGSYSADLSSLTDGPISSVLNVTDDAGNTAAANGAPIDLDTSAPTAASITSVTDDISPVTGTLTSGARTNDPDLTVKVGLTGTGALAGDTIQLYNGSGTGSQLGTSYTLTASDVTNGFANVQTGTLVNGTSYTITARVTDQAGNQSAVSTNSFAVTEDTSAPTAASITSVTDDISPVTGTLTSGARTNDPDLTVKVGLTGTGALAGDTIQLYNGSGTGSQLGTSYTLTASDVTNGFANVQTGTLVNGTSYTITARVTDQAGNQSAVSTNSFAVTEDTSAPTAASITSVTDDISPVTGTLTSGARTNDPDLTVKVGLTGTGALAGDTIQLYNGSGTGSQLGTSYTLTASDVTNGFANVQTGTLVNGTSYTITARVTDQAGNQSAVSTNSFAVTEDTSAPTAASITSVTDDISPVTGTLTSGARTNDPDLTVKVGLTGTGALAGDTIQLYNGSGTGSQLGTSYTLTASDVTNGFANVQTGTLVNGTSYTITARVTDQAGNQSAVSTNSFAVTEDTSAPTAASITSVTDDISPVTGTLTSGARTNDPDLTVKVGLTGTGALAGDTIQLYNGSGTGSQLGTSYTLTASDVTNGFANVQTGTLVNGTSYTITARVTDQAGNQSAVSTNSFAVTEDTASPAITSHSYSTSSKQLSIVATDNVGVQSVQVTDTDPTPDVNYTLSLSAGTATNGTWTVNTGTNINNDHITITVTDFAGNQFIQTTTAPAGSAGSPINLGLTAPSVAEGTSFALTVDLPSNWSVAGAMQLATNQWDVTSSSLGALTVIAPSSFTGAVLLNLTLTWTKTDGSVHTMQVADNLEAYAPGSPIFAWSGNDALTGSSGQDTFVFSQPIGNDVVHSFDVSSDVIDLISYGWHTFSDVQSHTADDAGGNAVITLADGQTVTLDGVHAADLIAANFEFDVTPTVENSGPMTIGDGAMLPLSGAIHNTGTIELQSAGDDTLLQLIQTGITLNGGGQLTLSDDDHNIIAGTVANVTFDNVDNVISGAGQIGQGSLTLSNEGTIDATGAHALVIDTGTNVVVNAGTLEATGSGGLTIESAIANSGLLWANGGTVTAQAEVTGSGTAEISGTGTMEFGAASSANIIFDANATGHLILDDAFHFTGAVSGLAASNDIDLKGIAFGADTTLSFTENQAGTGGTLTVSDGAHTANIVLLGQYDPTAFNEKADTTTGTVISYDPHHIA